MMVARMFFYGSGENTAYNLHRHDRIKRRPLQHRDLRDYVSRCISIMFLIPHSKILYFSSYKE